MIADVLTDTTERMDRAVEVAKEDFASIRTGRANPAMFQKVMINYYGTPTPLNQLAGLQNPEARTMLITPYDKGALRDIEAAIRDIPNLGASPSNDGAVIRVQLPELTEERRREYVKVVKTKGEEHKIAIRNERRDAKEMVEEAVKEGELTEDEGKKALEKVQAEVDLGVKKVDEIVAAKEKDLMQV